MKRCTPPQRSARPRAQGKKAVLEECGLSVGTDQGENRGSGDKASGEPGTAPQDSPQLPSAARSRTSRKQLPPGKPRGGTTKHPPRTQATRQPPRTQTTKQPPRTLVTKQPPRTLATKQPPRTQAIKQPPRTRIIKQPSGTLVTKQPPRTWVTKQPSTWVTKQPLRTRVTKQPSRTLVTKQPPRTLATRQPPESLVTNQPPITPAPSPPQMTQRLAPSWMVNLQPWDPYYEARPQLTGAGSGVGSFSNRTLSHPSFWPLYEAASRRELGEQAPRDAGIPVLNCEEVFVSDPLLPCGYRVPLYLDRTPQQVMNPLKLLLPPPIMSSCVAPTSSSACSTNWLSELEMVALKALLQMSQEGPTCSPSSDSMLQANCLDFVSSNPASHGGPRYSHFPDPLLPQTPDTDSP